MPVRLHWNREWQKASTFKSEPPCRPFEKLNNLQLRQILRIHQARRLALEVEDKINSLRRTSGSNIIRP